MNMPVLMHFHIIGQNISEHRKAMHLTQEQLAELAGISQQFLCRLEGGKGIPSVTTIMALCDAMDIEANQLLTRNSATHDADAPCRLRSDGSVFDGFLNDTTTSECKETLIVISPEDLPILDLEIPDSFND